MSKVQNFKCRYSLNNFDRDLRRNIHEFWEANLVCSFRGDVVWNFAPMWSHVNENQKKIGKNPQFEFHNYLNKQLW